jgi:hypothetical protein
MSPADVERQLVNWASWMRSGGGVRGYPRSVPGVMVGGNIASWEDLCDSCDKAAARATDASIQDLPGIEQAAITHYHLASVWRFNRETVEIVYDRAVIELGESLTRKGMV